MARSIRKIWTIDGLDIPVIIYKEWRPNNRISVGKKHIIVRISKVSNLLSNSSIKPWAVDWLSRQFIKHPQIKERFVHRNYHSDQIIQTARKNYSLAINTEDRKTNTAKLKGEQILLNLNHNLSNIEESNIISSLISRIIAKDQKELITRRIMELNKQHFGKQVKAIRLKNNSSNWGSCSSSNNINISTKTLLLPLDVQDYIFVHELAHLVELNHSKRYWALVEKVMPGYRQYESWLKNEGRFIRL